MTGRRFNGSFVEAAILCAHHEKLSQQGMFRLLKQIRKGTLFPIGKLCYNRQTQRTGAGTDELDVGEDQNYFFQYGLRQRDGILQAGQGRNPGAAGKLCDLYCPGHGGILCGLSGTGTDQIRLLLYLPKI
jgi:hypothetical protein